MIKVQNLANVRSASVPGLMIWNDDPLVRNWGDKVPGSDA